MEQPGGGLEQLTVHGVCGEQVELGGGVFGGGGVQVEVVAGAPAAACSTCGGCSWFTASCLKHRGST